VISDFRRTPSLLPSRRRNSQLPSATRLRPKPSAYLRIPPVVTSPAEPRLASNFLRILFFGLAEDNLRLRLNATVLLSRRRNANCYRTSHRPATPGMSFPTSLESSIPRLAPRSLISDFHRVLSLQPSRRCNFQFPSAFAPSTEAVGSSAAFRWLLPLLLSRASLPTSLGVLSSAWPRLDLRLWLKLPCCSTGDETPTVTELRIALPRRG